MIVNGRSPGAGSVISDGHLTPSLINYLDRADYATNW